MFKSIKAFFNTEKEKTSEVKQVIVKSVDPIDWALGGMDATKKMSYRKMVHEPVLSLINGFMKNDRRFKIRKLSFCEYSSLNYENYNWFCDNTVSFYKFTDTKSGISHTVVLNRNSIFRIDDLPFTLNQWELTVLCKAYIKSRSAANERVSKWRQDKMKKKLILQQKEELQRREEYQRKFQ